MDVDELSSQIECEIAGSTHLVMIKAIDKIGPCTYAQHLMPYVRARIRLSRMRDYEWYLMHPPQTAEVENRKWRDLWDQIIFHHTEMYRQPCLICDLCQNRIKLWNNSPYNLFGAPSKKRSENRAKRLLAV